MSFSLKDDILKAAEEGKKISDAKAELKRQVREEVLAEIEDYLYEELRPYCSAARIDTILDNLMKDLK